MTDKFGLIDVILNSESVKPLSPVNRIKCLRIEVRPSNIRKIIVCPAVIKTEWSKHIYQATIQEANKDYIGVRISSDIFTHLFAVAISKLDEFD